MEEHTDARNRFTALAARHDYRLARLELDLEHLSLQGSGDSPHPRHLLADLLSLRRAERGRIDELLARISAGTYGRCGKCQRAIGADRLRRLPHAAYCAACVFGDDPDFRAHIAHQHDSLEQLLNALQGLSRDLLARGTQDVSLAGSDAVAELLSDLSEELAEHFALEETDGYLAELTRVAPGLSEEVQSVQRQHVELCGLANELAEMAREAGTGVDAWRRIDVALRAFGERLRSHEREELKMTESTFSAA